MSELDGGIDSGGQRKGVATFREKCYKPVKPKCRYEKQVMQQGAIR